MHFADGPSTVPDASNHTPALTVDLTTEVPASGVDEPIPDVTGA